MMSSDPNTEPSIEKQKDVGVTSPAQERLATTATDGKSKKRSKTPPIDSMGQLLRRVYTGRRLKSKLTKKEASAMGATARLDELEREELLTLAMSDRLLDRTRQLMLFVDGLEPHVVPRVVKVQLNDFVGGVLRRHPAYRTGRLGGVLEHLPQAPKEDIAVQEMVSQDFSSFSWSSDAGPLKRSETELCKANAVYCLLLWFRARRGMSVDRIQRYIQESLWKHAALRHKTEAEKLRALMGTRDYSAASIACAHIEKQALEQGHRADVALRAEERAKGRAGELEEQIAVIQGQLTESHSEIERLKKEVAEGVQARGDDHAHLKDDYEQLRGHILRRLEDELSLLDEGLHALRRKPPKVYVMVDHAERAIDGLKGEMKRLRGIGA